MCNYNSLLIRQSINQSNVKVSQRYMEYIRLHVRVCYNGDKCVSSAPMQFLKVRGESVGKAILGRRLINRMRRHIVNIDAR